MDKTAKIIELVAEIADVDACMLNADTLRADVEEWDSLCNVQIISEIEEEFGVSIPVEAFSSVKSIADLVELVK